MRPRAVGGVVAMLALACPKSDPPRTIEDTGVSDLGAPSEILPVETSDDDALAELASWSTLPLLRSDRQYRQQSSTDRGTGGDGGIRLLKNGNRDLNNFVCAGEGAEGGKPLVPLVLDTPRCPETYVKGFVVSRFEGSGRMTRLWMTALSWRGAPPDDEILRIYVDDASTPIVQVPVSKALDGSAGEIFAPPFGAGVTRFLAWHYPVVFGSKLIVSIDGFGLLDTYYHQTDVVLDTTRLARKASPVRVAKRDEAKKTLSSAILPDVLLAPTAVGLVPEKETVVADLSGPATAQGLLVRVPEAQLPSLDRIDLAIRWDDATAPSIAATLAELYGSTLGAPLGVSGVLLGAQKIGSDIQLALSFPMPFAKRAQLSMTNHTTSTFDVRVEIRGQKTVPSGKFGNLQLERHETKGPTTLTHHPIASVKGQGRYVGTCLAMEGHALPGSDLTVDPLNFLEGDERATIDGLRAIVGTGTEDYFDSAFYFVGEAGTTPFARWWGVRTSGTRGTANACRFHALNDAIDFASTFDLDLEIGPGDPSLLDRYRSIAFYYR